ncbi:ShlB/FhaC/HecB family hemolysin secretion/activation protein [Thioalkalivibrio sp. ALE23]|uniref:ShlB/FhaC/HecB family hemolysin secretion/activation protein n=1 Tax=Thioalkalivibrio sp. ALE23 TaxID=1265495 RepID=UPI000366D58A|nr:ShlB/FhaC/HecB family hemolysin secretion/activation protein [Thioalkalivibrio sp. ALE23]
MNLNPNQWKRTPLAVALGLSLGLSPAVADEISWSVDYPDHMELGDYPRSIDEADPREELTRILEQLQEEGYPHLYADADADARQIHILEADHVAEGPLKAYLGEDLSRTEGNLPLMDEAARARGGEPSIDYGAVEDGEIPVRAEVEETDRDFIGAMVSSYGGRHTGENVATVLFQQSALNTNWSGSYSRGLEFLTPSDAEDGRYDAISLKGEHPTPVGVFWAELGYSESKQGGDLTLFDLNSEVYRGSLGYRLPQGNWEPYAQVNTFRQVSNIGLVELDGEQRTTSLEAGMEMRHSIDTPADAPLSLVWNASLEQGLDTRTSGFGLGRDPDNSWTRLTGDVELAQPLNEWLFSLRAGFQENNGTLPNIRDFTIGGQHRGNGYRQGVASVTDGQYAGFRMASPRLGGDTFQARPFVGYNASTGRPEVGDRKSIQSVEAGLNIRLTDHVSGELGYAWVTNDRNIETDEGTGRANFHLIARW